MVEEDKVNHGSSIIFVGDMILYHHEGHETHEGIEKKLISSLHVLHVLHALHGELLL